MRKNPYKILSSKTVYKNPWIEVKEDKVIRPDGEHGVFGTVDYGEGVTVVAINDKKETYLIKEFYYVLNEYGIQTPSGGIEKDETPLDAAKKELLEEAGVTAKKWVSLGIINQFTTIIKARQYLYLAIEAKQTEKSEEETDVIKVSFNKAYDMVLNNEITYAPSCLAILKAKVYLEQNMHS